MLVGFCDEWKRALSPVARTPTHVHVTELYCFMFIILALLAILGNSLNINRKIFRVSINEDLEQKIISLLASSVLLYLSFNSK